MVISSAGGIVARAPAVACLHVAHLGRGDVLADDLPAEIHKGFVDVGAAAGARFVVGRVAPGLRDGEGAGPRHGPVFFQVGFVADDDQRHARVVLYPHDLIAEFVQFREGGERGDTEDEEEALAGFHVEFPIAARVGEGAF